MTTLASRTGLMLAVAASLLLAGCAPTATAPSSGSDDAPPAESSDTTAATCSTYADQSDPELRLFTSSAIAAGPTEGQTYGDGTELSITLSQQAVDAGLLPLFDLLTVSDTGGPVVVSSLAFDPTTGGDGTYSTDQLEFGNDELVGTAIVAEFYAISTATIDGAEQYGDKLLLGNYCMTYANDGS